MRFRWTALFRLLLLASGLLVAGCSSLAPAAPTSTLVPTPAAAPTLAPATSVPTATTAPQAAPTTGASAPTTAAPQTSPTRSAAGTGPGATSASPTRTGNTAGPSASATPAVGATCTNNAVFVSDVTVPDNTSVATGQAFNKIWRIRNTGTCTWGPGYTFAFVTGTAMTTNTSAGIAVPQVAPGATADIVAPLTAPNTAGTYRGFWQMRAPNGTPFGQRVWVLVRAVRLSNAPANNGNGGTPSPGAGGTPAAPQAPAATSTS